MDCNLKQWRYQSDLQHEPASAKLPRLLLDFPYQQQQQQQQPICSEFPTALPLFVPELTSKLSNLSAFPPTDSTTTSTRFPKMGSYFSLAQWQELELQALIFRHMLAGASVPPELLHLVKKSLSTPPYFLNHHPLQQYPLCHPALLQSGYWGRASMDPEPGRCRRTDGKKWRCSRDVVTGQKYCERHVHRGRNRSRKPVENPTPTTTTASDGSGGGATTGYGGGVVLKNNIAFAAQPLAGGTRFDLSGPSPSIDLLHLNQRSSESRTDNKSLFQARTEASTDGKSDARVLRHFFDDWPKPLQEPDNGSPVTSSPCLSISTPGNPSSDFSLKLSTGNGDGPNHQEGNSVERERIHLNWAGGWGTNQVGPMGGPLAEALRSSTSNSSPKSVLHQLPRCSTSETSYVST